MTITLDNTAAATNILQLQSLVDNLPSDMVFAAPPNPTSDCTSYVPTATAGGSQLSGSGNAIISLNAGASCSISVDVVANYIGTRVNTTESAFVTLSNFLFQSIPAASATLTGTGDLLQLTKDFVNDPVAAGTYLNIQYNISNRDRVNPASAITFTDDLDSTLTGLAVMGSANVTNCGSGATVTGTGIMNFSGGSLAAGASCSFTVIIMVPAGAANGSYSGTTSAITGTIAGGPATGNAATDTLIVAPTLTIAKEFTDDPVSPGATVNLRYTITNPNASDMATGITFTDSLSDYGIGLTGASVTLPATPCGTGSSLSISTPDADVFVLNLTGGTLAANTSCVFDIPVSLPADAPGGQFSTTTSNVTGTVAGTSAQGTGATDALMILSAPSLVKQFTNDPVLPGNSVTLEYQISNPDPTNAMTAISFTDDLNAALSGLTATSLPTTTQCGAGSSITGTTSLTFSGGILGAGATCAFSVTLAVPAGSGSGTFASTTSAITATVNSQAVTGATASDSLVVSALTISASLSPTTAVPGGTVDLTFNLANPGTEAATAIALIGNYTAALSGTDILAPLPSVSSCGAGAVLSEIGTGFLILTGAELAASTNCSYTVQVQIPANAASGTYKLNTTATAVVGGSAITLPAFLAELSVNSEFLQLSQNFTNDPVAPGSNVNLEFTLTNLDTAQAASNIQYTVDLDSALSGLAATGLPANDVCGSGSSISGTGTLTFSGGSLALNGTCTFSVAVAVPGSAAFGSTIAVQSSQVTGTINALNVTGSANTENLLISAAPVAQPTLSIGAPSATLSTGADVTYMLTYANTTSIALSSSNITLNRSGSATGSVSVSAVTVNSALVTVSSPSGSGTLGISVAANTGRNGAGDPVPAAGPSTTFTVDTVAPVITLTGDNPQTVAQGGSYTEMGATTDDGSAVTIDASAVNTTALGNYNVTYNSTDANGNAAIQVTRVVAVTDQTPPVITLTGSNPQTIERLNAYVELGATTDDGSMVVIDASAVNTSAVGNYQVTYNSTDAANNAAAQVIRMVSVVDTTAPVITLNGANPQTVELGSAYMELGAGTDDGSQVNIDASAVNVNAIGDYIVTYNSTDASNNSAVQVTRTVSVVDTTAPVITLTGANPQTIERTNAYTELGATTDDGSTVVIDSSAVNTNVTGDYTVTYNATDASNNQAVQVTRTVRVVDTTAPVITLTGANPQTIEKGTAYQELNATTDDGSQLVIDSSAVNTNVVGTYMVTYNATDSANNMAIQVSRTVNVVDTTPPVISLNGSNPQIVELNGAYAEQGATADDGSMIVIDSSAVNVNQLGDYTVTYNATDAANNSAVQVTRTVRVTDTTAPIITLTGSNPQTIEFGSGYTELGATTNDGSAVTIDASAFVDTVGSYMITYDSVDGSNNAAVQQIRTVNVVDTTPPVISEVQAIITPNSDPTPSYSFNSSEPGTILFSGACTSATTNAVTGLNQIEFSTLADGTYSNCFVSVQDGSGNMSQQLALASFVVDTQGPVVRITPPVSLTTSAGPVEFVLSIEGASLVIPGVTNLNLSVTGDVMADLAISGTGLTERRVQVSNITGDGTLTLSVLESFAVDNIGNASAAVGPSAEVVVDNISVAIAQIVDYANGNLANAPDVSTFARAKVTGVNDSNLAQVLEALQQIAGTEIDTQQKLQAFLDQILVSDEPPVLPNGAAITVTPEVDQAMASWPAAEDALQDRRALQYDLVVTDSVSGISQTMRTELLNLLVENLAPGRAHNFALTVIDQAGNRVEYPATTATTLEAVDADGNGLGDNLLTAGSGTGGDADGDGISDDLESFLGIDVTHTTDTNGNGIPDVVELRQGIDVRSSSTAFVGATRPEISLTNDISRVADGSFTAVPSNVSINNASGAAQVFLRAGNCGGAILPANFASACIAVPLDASGNPVLISGSSSLWWIVTDSSGNWPAGGALLQQISLLPLLEFSSSSSIAALNADINITAQLSGPLVDPASDLSVPLTTVENTSGGAVQTDLVFSAGSQTGSAGVQSGPNAGTLRLEINSNADVIAGSGVSNPVAPQRVGIGNQGQLTIDVRDGNLAPSLSLRFTNANGDPVSTAVIGDAGISVVATATDPNSDPLTYDWSATTDFAAPTDTVTSRFSVTVDQTGNFEARLTVSDGEFNRAGTATLQVLASNPLAGVSPTRDTDGDGKPDIDEGLVDLDGDNIPDYLERLDQTSALLPINDAETGFISTEPGLRLALGSASIGSSIAQGGDSYRAVVNQSGANPILPSDPLGNDSHIVDFGVSNLATAGQQVNVVIPLDQDIPATAVYRKYFADALPGFPARSGWVDFDTTTLNANGLVDALSSAAQLAVGACPDHDANSWSAGLNAGDRCLRLSISDGGPNDADGQEDFRISDPGAVVSTLLGISPQNSTFEISVSSIAADGTSTAELRITLNDANGASIPGATIGLSVTSGDGLATISEPVDAGGGVYTATLTAGSTAGTVVIAASASDRNATESLGEQSIQLTAVSTATPAPTVTSSSGGGGCALGNGSNDYGVVMLLLLLLARMLYKALPHRQCHGQNR